MSIKAISTYGITLKWGEAAASVTKTVDIKDYPDLGGAPETLETTTLSDPMHTFINGIQSSGAMPFTINYLSATLRISWLIKTPLFFTNYHSVKTVRKVLSHGEGSTMLTSRELELMKYLKSL